MAHPSLLARRLPRPERGQHLRPLLRSRAEPDCRLPAGRGRLGQADRADRGVSLGRALCGGGRLSPRRRAQLGGQADHRRGPPAARERRHGRDAPRAGVLPRRHHGTERGALRADRRGRHRHARRGPREGGGRGSARRASGGDHRVGRFRRRRGRGLRVDQRDAPGGHRLARLRAAHPDLPQPDLLADPVLLGGRRGGQLTRPGLPALGDGRDRYRPVLGHPHRPRLRRGHRLRAADRRPLSRRAPPRAGQARRRADRHAHGGSRDRRLRGNGHRRPALPVAGRGQRHVRPGADRGHGDRRRHARHVHPPPRSARHLRAARVLALRTALRRRGRGRDPRHVAADRRARGLAAAAGLDRRVAAPRRDEPRAPDLQHQPDHGERLPRRRDLDPRPGPRRARLPGRRQRAQHRPRAEPESSRAGPGRAAASGPRSPSWDPSRPARRARGST